VRVVGVAVVVTVDRRVVADHVELVEGRGVHPPLTQAGFGCATRARPRSSTPRRSRPPPRQRPEPLGGCPFSRAGSSRSSVRCVRRSPLRRDAGGDQ
jgi:hypothetical protein